jgi:hypothetical protein
MKQVRWLLCVGMVAVLALSIGGCDRKPAGKIDFGAVEGSVYTNRYLGLKIPIPQGWSVQDNKAKKALMESGKQMTAGKDANLKAAMEASELNSVPLLMIFKYPVGSAVDFNPSFTSVAEKVSQMPGITRGSDYLFHVKKLLQQAQIKYSIADAIRTEMIGGVSFDVLDATLSVGNTVVNQKYYATIMKGYALSLIVTYNSTDDQKELTSLFSSIAFAR